MSSHKITTDRIGRYLAKILRIFISKTELGSFLSEGFSAGKLRKKEPIPSVVQVVLFRIVLKEATPREVR
jgi:hypothetical protein